MRLTMERLERGKACVTAEDASESQIKFQCTDQLDEVHLALRLLHTAEALLWGVAGSRAGEISEVIGRLEEEW